MPDDHVTDDLIDALSLGRPLTPQIEAHLSRCQECRELWATLSRLQWALLTEAASPPVAPPPALRGELLSRAREMVPPAEVVQAGGTGKPDAPVVRSARPALRLALFPRIALGAAAVAAILTTLSLLVSPPGLAHALPDPAVVVNAGGPLLVASNGDLPASPGKSSHQARLTIITGERVSATLDVSAPNPAWFTEGVRLDERVYLADAGNDRVLEVQIRPLKLLNSFPVSGGVAGLSTGMGRVYFKSVRGQVGLLPSGNDAGLSRSLAHEGQMPMADVMDGVLLQGDTLYVTHHLRGELCLLDPQTLAVRQRIRLGGAPVALAGVPGGLLVLDVKGRLLRLNASGQVQQRWNLPGQPDKLVLNGDRAVVSDRAGGVTQLDLSSSVQTRVTLRHPMDLTLTEDGMVAVAQGQTGVALLGADLKPMAGGEIR